MGWVKFTANIADMPPRAMLSNNPGFRPTTAASAPLEDEDDDMILDIYSTVCDWIGAACCDGCNTGGSLIYGSQLSKAVLLFVGLGLEDGWLAGWRPSDGSKVTGRTVRLSDRQQQQQQMAVCWSEEKRGEEQKPNLFLSF